MPKAFLTILTFFIALQGFSQYYIRGDVKDENNEALQNVKIYFPATKSIYYSGMTGGFGIPAAHLYDSLIFTKDGYDTLSLKVKTDEYQHIVLKKYSGKGFIPTEKMASFTTGADANKSAISTFYGETYSTLIENNFIKTTTKAKTTFGIRIDKAAYSNVRRFINQETQVPPDAVRVDEMLNYFNFNYKQPDSGKKFCLETRVTDCPWNDKHKLLYLNLSAQKLNLENVPPSNFVFLIDVSGSMDLPNRLPLIKEAFQLLVSNLRAKDTVSIVVYGGSVGIWLPPTSGAEKEKIRESIEKLTATGDTPGEAAIKLAYKLAENTFIKGGNNRIILATDGDFNIGQTTEKELEELITKQKQSGVYLTCLGVGMGNYKDSKIETLSKKGNGNFAYIDNIREAEKVLVLQFTQTLYSVASDVYLTVQFNPEVVAQYRLIGYDNRKSGFKEVIGEPEGGEIGSASGNTIVFELEPSETDSSLRNMRTANFTVHYKNPGDSVDRVVDFACFYNYQPFNSLTKSLQFATAVTMFGLKIKSSRYFPDVSWDSIHKIAAASLDKNDFLQNQFIDLIDQCKSLYDNKRRKKRR